MSRKGSPATIIDVAKAAGVSKSAAARVLSNNGSASARTRMAVLDAAARLGYRPNQLAKAMKAGSTQSIGIVVPDVANPFFSSVLSGFSAAARSAGFEVIVMSTDNTADIEARSLELLAEKRVDGIAVAPALTDASPTIEQLRSEGLPLVLIDRRLPNLGAIPLVSMDHAAATELATQALITSGHSDIAIVTEARATASEITELLDLDDHATSLLRPSMQRLVGHARALRAHDIAFDESLVVTAPYDREQAAVVVADFLRTDHHATAIHGTNAILSYASYRAFKQLGVVIPDDLSFVGFDDQDWMLLVHPAVTVVGQAARELGEAAAQTLIQRIAQDTDVHDVFLSARLIERGSIREVNPA
ncbi:LacI family DNA-binding transcriptional regulator [Microbacterium mitrae]|nr:LacI family DNA-binding transcriptional regulator [Microbacterium mitrae]